MIFLNLFKFGFLIYFWSKVEHPLPDFEGTTKKAGGERLCEVGTGTVGRDERGRRKMADAVPAAKARDWVAQQVHDFFNSGEKVKHHTVWGVCVIFIPT